MAAKVDPIIRVFRFKFKGKEYKFVLTRKRLIYISIILLIMILLLLLVGCNKEEEKAPAPVPNSVQRVNKVETTKKTATKTKPSPTSKAKSGTKTGVLGAAATPAPSGAAGAPGATGVPGSSGSGGGSYTEGSVGDTYTEGDVTNNYYYYTNPTPTTDGGSGAPTPTTGGGGVPTPTTGVGDPTPTPTLGVGEPTSTPTLGVGEPTPTPTLGIGDPTLTPTPTLAIGEPTPTPTLDLDEPTQTPTITPTTPPFVQGGYNITGLPWGLYAVSSEDWNTNYSYEKKLGVNGTGLRDWRRMIAEMDVNYDSDKYWGGITAGSWGDKAYMHYPDGFYSIPGATGSGYSLYVVKGNGTMVGVCPGARNFDEIGKECSDIYYADEYDPRVEVVEIDGLTYWKISELTGTGAFSLIGVKDTLSRLKVGVDSDHNIEYSTTIAIDGSGDTVEIDIDSSFDFNGINIEDIDLEDDTSDVTLCTGATSCSSSAGVWGVNIDSSQRTITFTAPTDVIGSPVVAGSVMNIKIGLNATNQATGDTQITNPSSAGAYEVAVRLTSGVESEYGEMEIPIVDNDTVNVRGFIDSFLTFDIDTVTDTTAVTGTDCDATGGSTPCDSHGGVVDGAGYVVDLGEMNTTQINNSGLSGVLHADGLTGNINAIGLDVESNANNGISLTFESLSEKLAGPGSNEIPSVAGGPVSISAGDGRYGMREIDNTTSTGAFSMISTYNGGAGLYGNLVDSGTPIQLATSSGPVEGRVLLEMAATPDSLDGTGTYTDELTFVLTATY